MFDSPEKLALGLISGIAFGFLLQKGRVAKFHVIVGQFLLKDWTVLKVMLTAVAVGAVGVWAMVSLGMASLTIKPAAFGGVIVGAVLFGVGMAIFGYCPGTSVAACGEGRRDAMVGVARHARGRPRVCRGLPDPAGPGQGVRRLGGGNPADADGTVAMALRRRARAGGSSLARLCRAATHHPTLKRMLVMALVFERVQTEGIAELSYLLGDDSDGVAAVFDPTPDVEKYVELARQKSVSITHIFETHIHADLVSGARELCARVGSAKIFLSHEGDARYGFDHEKLEDGDRFTIGKTVVTVKHTPGHTPEHLSYLLAEKDHPEIPWGVLTGDSLFVSSAGRPDLLGDDESEKLAAQQFHTLRDFYLGLPDGVMIYPGHGARFALRRRHRRAA